MAHTRPTNTLPPHEHFARDAICVAYKRYLGIHQREDDAESIQRFAEVMTDGGIETFIGKARESIVEILRERPQARDSVPSAQIRGQ